MGSLTIHDLDETLKASLAQRAAAHGRTPEEEAVAILSQALGTGPSLYAVIREIVEPVGGFELELPPRGTSRDPPDFSSSDFDP